MFNYLCEECGKGTVEETVVKNYEVRIFEKPFIVPSAKIGLCDECGSFNYDGNEMHRWKDLYNAWEAKSEDYVSPKDIRLIRKSVGLNQRDFAVFIGVTRQSLSAWENDKRPSVQPQSVDIVLRMLFTELESDEKPVTIKMIEEYYHRTGNHIQSETNHYLQPRNKNKILKNILPKTTWDELLARAKKDRTDPFTEIVLSIESERDEPIREHVVGYIREGEK